MVEFMDDNFLLTTETARSLYHEHARKMPIIDYHCHINPKEIYEDTVYGNLSQLWLSGDHYKWRAMRSNGVDEFFITGQAEPYAKFEKWAETVPKLIGNPLYHWTHLELKRYFHIDKPLTARTSQEVWDSANAELKNLSVRKIIEMSDVRLICTTDDPLDNLQWHKLIQEDQSCTVKVLPAFRLDKAINIDKPGFAGYIKALGNLCGIEIKSLQDIKTALSDRIDYFMKMGCKAADHGLDYIVYVKSSENLDNTLLDVLAGNPISQEQADAYKTELLMFCASQYQEKGMVMQLHFGAARNNNPLAFQLLGPDTGFDAVYGHADSGASLGALLGALVNTGSLPKTIIYSLNPTDNTQIGSILGCFQSFEAAGKIQQGSAWWFNDHKTGMIDQMTSLANLSVFANFVGMLTDSRSFLSYTRHEYFRRLLCGLVGGWVETGEYPADMAYLGQMVEDISYNNVVKYFGFEMEKPSCK